MKTDLNGLFTVLVVLIVLIGSVAISLGYNEVQNVGYDLQLVLLSALLGSLINASME